MVSAERRVERRPAAPGARPWRAAASSARAVGVGLRCFVPGIGAETPPKLLGHGDVHRVDRRSGRKSSAICASLPAMSSARSAVAATMALATSCARLPTTRIVPGEARGRVEPHLAARADRAAVRGRPAQTVDADRVAVRGQARADAGELESGLVVADAPLRERDRSRARRASCGVPRTCIATVTAPPTRPPGGGQRDVGEAGVEPAVDLEVERRRRPSSGAEPVTRTALPAPGVDREVDRGPAAAEAPGSRDVERRQAGALRSGAR